MSGKKRVYVETTVISDATALPARDIVQLGRQVVTREWWASAAQRFELYSSVRVMYVRVSAPRRCSRKEVANDSREAL